MDPVSIFFGCINCLCTPNCLHKQLARQCKYLRGQKEKVKIMEKKMKDLNVQASDIERKLKAVYVQEGKEPKTEVTLWLENFQTIEKEVQSLMGKVGEEQRCLNGCFPNYRSRLKLGKEIEEKTNTVNELLDNGQVLNGQLPDLQQEKAKPLPTTTLVGKTTAERNFEKIWDYIMDENIGMIGVFGMGGVGKTTIMKHIHNRLLKESTRFDEIIWITVSKDSNREKLQIDIGNKLKLELKHYKDEMSRASELLAALKRRKRFMLFLDDMWNAFPLEDVGIPNPIRENIGCKVVLTTRSRKVCLGMKTQREVEVKVLSEDEAWELFKEQVGEDVLHSSYILDVAKEVAKECDGLPLGLIVVGKALRKVENVMVWKNALKELRDSTGDIEEFEDQVFKTLKFSYDHLKSDMTRNCFLYCALYPEDHHIKSTELVEHWIGESLIDDLKHREDQINKAITILEDMKNAAILENAGSDYLGYEYVKMHDLVRDLAIRIQSPKCKIKAGFGSKEAPRDEEWKEDLERISLMRNKLEQLIGEPKCPNLSSLLLQHNPLRDISPSFFQQMYNLRVVNLSSTDMEFLPESLFELEKLRALLLNNCKKLKKLPLVANLKSLRTLDLSDTSITELPPGMEMLVNLRRLDLWNCKLKMCPAKLLQKLTLLEDLSVVCEFSGGEESDGEEPEGEKGEETEEDEPEVTCLEELIKDTHLRRLDVYFKNSKNFNRYIGSGHWRQLARFTLFCKTTGDNSRLAGKNHISIEGGGMNVRGTWLVLPETTHQLDMRNCDTITRLSMCLPKSTKLRVCSIEGCMNMECIVMDGENNLPSLQRMDLEDLPKLSSLCKGVVAPGTLSSLKELLVKKCTNMKNLLTRGLLQHLQSLEEIYVFRCDEMEEIIVGMGEEDGDEKEKGEAGMMSSGGNKNEGNNNNNNSIITLPGPTSLLGDNNYLPSLQRMDLCFLPKLRSLYKGVVAPGTLSSLKVLKVRKCNNMKNLLTRGLLQHLQSLEKIKISFCSEMEEIIVGMGEEDGDEKEKGEAGMMSSGGNKNEGNNNNNNSIITLPSPTSLPGDNNYLPSLQRMDLKFLPKLRSLCKGFVAPGTLSSLKVLHVFQCNNMKNLLTRGLLQHLQSLEVIDVQHCYGMEEIIGEGEGEEDDKERGGEEGIISTTSTINNNATITAILPMLQSLDLTGLPELKSICSSSKGVMVCNSLQTIWIESCEKLKKLAIVSMEENDNNGGTTLMGAPPGVKKIIGNNKWWDPQTSDHPDTHTFVQPFSTYRST